METAQNGGTYAVTVTFQDENGDDVTPNTILFTLTDGSRVINSRSDVSVTPASSVDIVLSGNDLLYSDGELRALIVYWTYDSSLGINLPNYHNEVFLIEKGRR